MGDLVRLVTIRRDSSEWTCNGPDVTGACPRAAPGEVVPCARGEVRVASAPDDLWVFTAPGTSHSCPISWLVTAPQLSTGWDWFAPEA